ncbi:hypothetical protein AKO1_014717 [Acrasis kona]|uniref:Vitellogenin n=1 Tax=Acrasis kona TaxID=1008807 RepID=A0AAW2Z0M0_9EUKA
MRISLKTAASYKNVIRHQIWTIEKVYAQVNGHCSCDESHFGKIDQGQITYRDEEQPMEKLEPLFLKKNNMFNVFASQPKSFTQMENFTMKIDDKRTMQFSLTLPPSEIPPSYKALLYLKFDNG